MRSGLGHPDLAVYRLVKAGDTGLNLSLTDLFGRTLEIPNLREIIKSFFTRRPIKITVKGFPINQIRALEMIQKTIDDKVEDEIEKAKRRTR